MYQHIVANGGQTNPPLFNAAIMGSTFLPPQYYVDDDVPEVPHSTLASFHYSRLSRPYTTRSSSKLGAYKTSSLHCSWLRCFHRCRNLDCLRKIDVDVLQKLSADMCVSAFSNTHPFAPVIDRTFIREAPQQAVAAGRINGVIIKGLIRANSQPEFQKRLEGLRVVHSAVEQAEYSRKQNGPIRREPIETEVRDPLTGQNHVC